MDLSIIIVSWNSEDLLRRCLKSVVDETKESTYEIIVIDNASKDQTVKMVMNEFSGVRIIQNEKNEGFAAAVNKGIQASSGEFVVLLNPDTMILDDALEQMMNYMRQHSQIGILGPNLVNEDGSTQASVRRFPKFMDQFLIMTKLRYLVPNAKSLIRYYARDFNYQYAQEVEQVMGACFMIRREVINQVGVLDENFFIWFEEVDYCKRVFDKTSFNIFYYPTAHVLHTLGDSFDKVNSATKQKWFNRSLRYYMRKHKMGFGAFILLLFDPLSKIAARLVGRSAKTKKGQKLVNEKRKQNKKA